MTKPIRIFSLLLLLLLSFSSNADQDDFEVNAFKELSLKITKGMESNQVESILGKPDSISNAKDNTDVIKLNATIGYSYAHPKDIMVNLLVGLKLNKVTGVLMCTEFEIEPRVYSTKCTSPIEYWKNENKT